VERGKRRWGREDGEREKVKRGKGESGREEERRTGK
jgi:hypothetical protein